MRIVLLVVAFVAALSFVPAVGSLSFAGEASALQDPPTCIRNGPPCGPPCVIGSNGYCLIKIYCVMDPCPHFP